MANNDAPRTRRSSLRLRTYDYSRAGAYFVTICTVGKHCLFGHITDDHMAVNECGRVVTESWQWLGEQYSSVDLDAWVVMPNHLHGIIVFNDTDAGIEKRKPLGGLIGAFKTVSTKRINLLRGTVGVPMWQRNYHEHVIRNDADLARIRHYIVDNPLRWTLDHENPDSIVLHQR